jgi:hypothetical protein
MPLVSRMLIAARGTRGAPPPAAKPRALRNGHSPDLRGAVHATLSHLAVARAELDLPLLCSRFADILLDPAAGNRADLPSIAPQAAIEVLLDLAKIQRQCSGAPEAQATFVRAASAAHMALNRWLCAHRETELQHAQPNLDLTRWIPRGLRGGPVVDALLDTLRTLIAVDLDRCVRNPVQIHRIESRDITVLTALGCVRYRFARYAHRSQAWTLRANGHFRPRHDAQIRPFAPLRSWDWLEAFVNRSAATIARVALATAGAFYDEHAQATRLRQWLHSTLRVHVRRTRCLHPVRRAVRAAMPYPREALELACRIRPDPRRALTAADVDQAESRQRELDPAIYPSPRLLHLAMLVTGTDALAASAEELKLELRSMGLSKNAWRLLCRHGVRTYAALIGSNWFNALRVEGVVQVANLIVACQRDGLPPPELLRYLVEVEDQGADDEAGLAPVFLLRAAWDAIRSVRGQRARRAFAEGQFGRALAWWWACRHQVRVPKGASWKWIDATATAWQARERIARCDGEAWPCPVEAFTVGAIRVVPLRTAVELWDEAQALRHCVWMQTFAHECRQGATQMFSLRDLRSDCPVATAAFRRKPGQPFEPWQLRGFANREVDRADVAAAAAAVLAALRSVDAHVKRIVQLL